MIFAPKASSPLTSTAITTSSQVRKTWRGVSSGPRKRTRSITTGPCRKIACVAGCDNSVTAGPVSAGA